MAKSKTHVADWTKRTSAQLAAEYKALVKRQRSLPLSEQWTMGSALKEAKARAMIAFEEEKLGIRS